MKQLAVFALALTFALNALAQGSSTKPTPTPKTTPTVALSSTPTAPAPDLGETESLFTANKFTVAPLAYARTDDFKHFERGAGLRFQYDVSESFALNLDLTGTDLSGALIEGGSVAAAYGVPLGKNVRVSGVAGLTYHVQDGNPGAIAGLRLEYRLKFLTASLDALCEQQMRHEGGPSAIFGGSLGFTF